MNGCSDSIIAGCLWVIEKAGIPLAAVFSGAWLAFRNDREKGKTVEREQRILAAHQLLFTLLQQFQDLQNLKSFAGDTEPDHLLKTALNETLINKSELAFVVRKHPNALNDAVLAEHEYLQAIDALHTYNEYTLPVQQFCREHAVELGEDGRIVFEVNEKTFPTFQIDRQQKTEAYAQLVNAINRGCAQNQDAAIVLRNLFRKMFPDEHFWEPEVAANVSL